MNRRSFVFLMGAAAGAAALTSTLFALPKNGDEHGHGHNKVKGDNGNHGNGHREEHDEGHGNGHGNGHSPGKQRGEGNDDRQERVEQDVRERNYPGRGPNQRYFRNEDEPRLAQYYDGPRDLPPGLRRKYYRNGRLPPGWQARFRPMPPALIQQLPPAPYGYQRGYYDGYAVVLNPRTRVLYDVVDLLGALQGR